MAKKKAAKKSAKAKPAKKKTSKKTKAPKKAKPAKKVAKKASRAKTKAGSGSGGRPSAVVIDVKPKKFKFKKKEPNVTIVGTGFTSGVVTFSTDDVTWTLDVPSLVTSTKVILDAKPEKMRASRKGPKRGTETGDLTVTVDSSDAEVFEVEFEPEDP